MVNIWNDKISFPLFIIRGDLWRCFGIKLHYNHCKGRISGATKLKIGILALGMTKLIPPPFLSIKQRGYGRRQKFPKEDENHSVCIFNIKSRQKVNTYFQVLNSKNV